MNGNSFNHASRIHAFARYRHNVARKDLKVPDLCEPNWRMWADGIFVPPKDSSRSRIRKVRAPSLLLVLNFFYRVRNSSGSGPITKGWTISTKRRWVMECGIDVWYHFA